MNVGTIQWRWALPAAAAIALADLATKELVKATFALGERTPVTGFFNLVYVLNPGAAFSFLADAGGWQRPVLLAIGIAVSGLLAYLLVRHPATRLAGAGFAFVLGGAIGNVVDRARQGAVVDWIDLHWQGWHWPAFNFADIGITVGVAALLLDSLLVERKRRAAAAGPAL